MPLCGTSCHRGRMPCEGRDHRRGRRLASVNDLGDLGGVAAVGRADRGSGGSRGVAHRWCREPGHRLAFGAGGSAGRGRPAGDPVRPPRHRPVRLGGLRQEPVLDGGSGRGRRRGAGRPACRVRTRGRRVNGWRDRPVAGCNPPRPRPLTHPDVDHRTGPPRPAAPGCVVPGPLRRDHEAPARHGRGARRGRRAGVRVDERRQLALRRGSRPQPGPAAFRPGPRLGEVREPPSHQRAAQ